MRTIRFDASDDHVYHSAAGPNEWAVSGAFAFAHLDAAELTGKTKQAFTNGFLSLETFGRATFVTVADIPEGEVEALSERLARHFVAEHGAPELAAALPAAHQEIGFVLELCQDVPVNTVLAVTRRVEEDGRIREAFRSVAAPSDQMHTRIWDVVEE